MTKSDIGYDYNEEQPQNPYVIFSLIAIMLLVVALLTYAGDGTSQQIASGQECVAMDDGSARLRCYDKLFDRTASEPAKGATAPLEVQ
jgi:hypothetical protein